MIPESKKTEFSSYTAEQLSELYKRDPDHFEEIAEAALSQACIGRTPAQTLKRRQMQWIIDTQLRKAKTPLERMHIMEGIFYGRVYSADGELAHLMDSCKELIQALGGTSSGSTERTVYAEQREPARITKPALYLVRK
jgi:hypothetical protein